MRKVGGTLLAVAIAVAGVIGLIAFFNSRDDSTTGGGQTGRPVPGEQTAASGDALLKSGNVVVRFSDASFKPALAKLAGELGAPDSPDLRAVGQAVVLRQDKTTAGVRAEAYEHKLVAANPSDPQLQAFIERWLGQGSSG
jgi:hypothetical protein